MNKEDFYHFYTNFYHFYTMRPKNLNDFSDIVNPVTGIDFKCNETTLCSFAQYLNVLPDGREDCFNKTWEIFLIKHKARTIGVTGYYILKHEPTIPWLTLFGVINEYQGCGAGTFILSQTQKFVRVNLGADFMRVYCIDDIVPFYIKNGFKLMGKAKDLNMVDKCESGDDNILLCDLRKIKPSFVKDNYTILRGD